MTQVHFLDSTIITVYESVADIVHKISVQYPWIQLSIEVHPKTKFVVVNSNYIIYIEEFESGDVCN